MTAAGKKKKTEKAGEKERELVFFSFDCVLVFRKIIMCFTIKKIKFNLLC